MGKYVTIQIPKSCHQDWNAMTPKAQGRHCNACQKTVVDFTTMTDTQLAHFFNTKPENVCGRFYDDQLDKQIAIPKKALPWLKYFFTISLPAFLFSQKALSQKRADKATIVLANKQVINKFDKVSSKQFLEKDNKDSIISLEEVVVHTTSALGRMRVTAGGVSYCTKTACKKTAQSKQPIAMSNANSITIFPNPITANSKLNIVWPYAVSSNQYIEIFDGNGNLMQKEMVVISAKTTSTFIWLSKIVTGIYFIKITDKKTKIKLSKGFVVS
jgi:hypothetical protein